MPNPPFVPKLSPQQWAEARRLRTQGLTFPDIAQHYGVTAHTIGARARKEGWDATTASAACGPRRARAKHVSPATAPIRRRLALRLFSVIECRIRMMELAMQKQLGALRQHPDSQPPALSRDERDTFAALIDSINQVTEMASEPASAANGGRKSVNPELTALSDELDAAGLAAASAKDDETARLAEQLAKIVGPA